MRETASWSCPAPDALDGGIALKPRQRLVGAGPPVRDAGTAAPSLTNTDPGRLDGDAVRLADRHDGPQPADRRHRARRDLRPRRHDARRSPATTSRPQHDLHARLPHPAVQRPDDRAGRRHPDQRRPAQRLGGDHGRRRARAREAHDHAATTSTTPTAATASTSAPRAPRRSRATIAGNDVRELRAGRRPRVGPRDRAADPRARRASSRASTTTARPGWATTRTSASGPSGADSEGDLRQPASGPSSMRVDGHAQHLHAHARAAAASRPTASSSCRMGDGSRGARRGPRQHASPARPATSSSSSRSARTRACGCAWTASSRRGSTGFSGTGIGDTVVIPGNNADCLIAASGGAGNTVDLDRAPQRADRLREQRPDVRLGGRQRAGPDARAAPRRQRLDDHRQPRRQPADRQRRGARPSSRVKVERTDLARQPRHRLDARRTSSAEDLGTTRSAMIDLGGGAARLGGRQLPGRRPARRRRRRLRRRARAQLVGLGVRAGTGPRRRRRRRARQRQPAA